MAFSLAQVKIENLHTMMASATNIHQGPLCLIFTGFVVIGRRFPYHSLGGATCMFVH